MLDTGKPLSITGLAFFLGFECRASFYDYEKREQYSYTMKRARLAIESFYENCLVTLRNASGPIFALKNFGWRDDHTINVNDERVRILEAFPEELKEGLLDESDNLSELTTPN